jgi:NADH-quinone oxidoreductase subunit L
MSRRPVLRIFGTRCSAYRAVGSDRLLLPPATAAGIGGGGLPRSASPAPRIVLCRHGFPAVATVTDPEWNRECGPFRAMHDHRRVSLGPAALYVALASRGRAGRAGLARQAYLHDDPRYAPYAAQVSLFTGAMLLVVTANDLIVLLVGWEVMGACSYLLIATTGGCPRRPAAAVKAFLVTRVGDVGFLLGIAV